MNRMKHCIVAVLIVSVFVVPLGITGCGSSESRKARQEEVVREAEHRQQLREEELKQTQQKTRKKQSEADGQDLENVGTAVGVGAGIAYILYLIFGGE
jgi:hypothetical protein